MQQIKWKQERISKLEEETIETTQSNRLKINKQTNNTTKTREHMALLKIPTIYHIRIPQGEEKEEELSVKSTGWKLSEFGNRYKPTDLWS